MKKNVENLYNDLLKYSWDNNVYNYTKLVFEKAYFYEQNDQKTYKLVDKVLKKCLSNLKSVVDYNMYDDILMNLGNYSNQDAYDFTIGIIKAYYDNEFIIDGKEYSFFDMANTIVEQYKTKDTITIPEIFHYMLACLFRLHYALYIKNEKNKENS